jgi:hypothetical protein
VSELKIKNVNSGKRFSSTFDEWSSVCNRRYMVINVHDESEYWSLGLIRVHGSMPAEKCVELVNQRLQEFGPSLENHTVAICTDGASVMRKAGRLISAEHQLCLAHGIHLAVLDVLYKKRNVGRVISAAESDAEDEMEGSQESDSRDTDSYVDSSHVEMEEAEDVEAEDQFEIIEDSYDDISELSTEYRETVEKVRKIVKLFRKSPTKNDSVLQKYVIEEHHKELELILDCPTRWSSLLGMLKRFAMLRTAIQKAMIDVSMTNHRTTQNQTTDFDFLPSSMILSQH